MSGRSRAAQIDINVTKGDAETDPDDVDGEGQESLRQSPLFSDLAAGSERLDHLVIYRIRPIDEGQLGRLPADATEDTIREEHGGGTFKLIGRTENNKPIKKAFKTVVVSGDPVFHSKTSEAKWARMTGQPVIAAAAAADANKPMSMMDFLLIQSKASDQSRAEAREAAAERAREAEASHRRQLELVREESKRDAARHESELARVKAEQDAKTERDREFLSAMTKNSQEMMVMMFQKQQGGTDPVQALIAGAQLAAGLGGGEMDPTTAFITHGADLMREIRGIAKDDAEETGGAAGGGGKRFVLTGAIAAKAEAARQKIKKAGKDPEVIFSKLLDMVVSGKPAAAPATGTTAPARPAAKPGAAKPAGPGAARRPITVVARPVAQAKPETPAAGNGSKPPQQMVG